MFTWLHNLFSCYLRQCLPKNIKEAHIKNYELLLKIPYPFIYQVLRFLKNNIYCKFKLLNDLISCDTLKKNNRFILIYHLLSIKFNARLKIYIEVKETSNIFSVANLYKSSN
jgi:NADH dehydrogenase (ubiquinone) Fe-S protein 3